VLGLSFRPFLALAFGRALTHDLLDGVVFGDHRPRLLAGDGGSIHIAQLVRFVLPQHDQHPVKEMGRTGTDRLFVMLAFVDHLIIVNRRDLRIEASGNLGIQVGKLFDEVWTSLRDMQALRLAGCTLRTVRHHAAPPSKEPGRVEALCIANETGVDGRTVLSHAFERLQVPARVDLFVQWADRLLAQGLVLLLQRSEPGLLSTDLGLQLREVQILILGAVES